MIGLRKRDVNKDTLMLFVMCYEHELSFTNVLRLYSISKKYFWIFMEVMSPMLKMGIRKASNLRKSVEKMLTCLDNPALTFELLTAKEETMLGTFKWLIEDSFSDGEGCLHISQFETIPATKAYLSNGLLAASNFTEMVKNVDRVEYILMGDIKFYKTSRLMYYIEKYAGDLSERELAALSIKEIMRRIADGTEKIQEQEAREYKNSTN